MSLFCCVIFSTDSYIISDIFRMSSTIFAFFSELKGNKNDITRKS
nr:MAG TPA: hypothetical protein [Caudoviricetes sp.]